MASQPPPPSASSHYATSALVAQQAASAAAKARPQGAAAVAGLVSTYQATQALLSERAVTQMLLEQDIAVEADAILNSLAFTTDVQSFTAMAEQADTDAEFERLVASLVQDAGRAAESVSIAVREDVYHVRFVSLPCCSRCALLAGRVYRYSDGFLRHPNCDCFMIPTTVASQMRQNPDDLVAQGQVRGLSKADTAAVAAGADLGGVVNVRAKQAGLKEAGRVLSRGGKPTPEGIYRLAGDDRGKTVELLTQFGYIR